VGGKLENMTSVLLQISAASNGEKMWKIGKPLT